MAPPWPQLPEACLLLARPVTRPLSSSLPSLLLAPCHPSGPCLWSGKGEKEWGPAPPGWGTPGSGKATPEPPQAFQWRSKALMEFTEN